MANAEKLAGEALSWVGYLEHKSRDALGEFRKNVGKGGCTVFATLIRREYPLRDYMGLPWCATFVHAIALLAYGKREAAHLLGKPHPGTRVLARRFRRTKRLRGRDHDPAPGDIQFCHNGDGKIGHCGVVLAVAGRYVYSIEGNTHDPSGTIEHGLGGAVAVRRRRLDDKAIVAYGVLEAGT